MKQSWTAGLDKELAVDVKQNFKESLVMRKRLQELLLDKASDSQKVGRSKNAYNNPNWAFVQADHRGYERALHEIIDLISEGNASE
jgi:predicted O-methyltransferase YrrM